MLKEINEDLTILKEKYKVSKLFSFFTNRGIHALIFYRVANKLFEFKIPLLPLLLTRIIQIVYSVDIDYRAKLEGGIVIIHGVGLVIGAGVVVKRHTIIYHQVTLGIKGSSVNDGFPIIEEGCVLGAGAKILGNVSCGQNSIVGANVVLTKDIDNNSIVKLGAPDIRRYKKINN
ncbi:serine O-acetyltransferase [Plebeiibacterium marinum]|uniref:Serine acetyltransferase n=1 Tax=Plebeiibacterium marinum TaxID=2992111 RepID=A0AAE3MEX7_9BACT|nr:hypothetical protein [Plebeiobacterium marinum]MCW3805817.1 hypothetical protein [Plebeiobacterium marinum]